MIVIEKTVAPMCIAGTVIDLETVGGFEDRFNSTDTRHYSPQKPTIFGYLTQDKLYQYCAEGTEDIQNIVTKMDKLLPTLEPPFYALNCHFERGVCTHSCSCVPEPLIDVRGENSYEKKWSVRARLGISTYDDPFNGNGYTCLLEWQKGNYTDSIKHNQACLQIERDILQQLHQV